MPERDRDERGRPRNARPRDALGRPLPRDAAGGWTEEPVPEDPRDALRAGIEHFDAERFFQAHEMWEAVWHGAPEAERDFWQGITQVAVGFTHWQRGNPTGAMTLLRRGAARLAPYAPSYHGLDVTGLAAAANGAADAIERHGAGATFPFPRIGER